MFTKRLLPYFINFPVTKYWEPDLIATAEINFMNIFINFFLIGTEIKDIFTLYFLCSSSTYITFLCVFSLHHFFLVINRCRNILYCRLCIMIFVNLWANKSKSSIKSNFECSHSYFQHKVLRTSPSPLLWYSNHQVVSTIMGWERKILNNFSYETPCKWKASIQDKLSAL